MTISPLFRVRELFDQLIALPDAQREDFLAAQTDIDADTRRHLHNLISADAQLAGQTARRAFVAGHGDTDWRERRIGAYEIVRELGRGGMGRVFLAQRIEGGVTQQAAIKIVRPDMLDTHTLARFRLERQVLALLQHPNIAGMLDLGELEDGSPYAVMEYVDGVPITQYLREHALDLRARLQLFLQVCDAVAYAHGNMIVHRDIKPGNVLVDGAGRPRLLDFGIAKPLLSRIGAINVEETQFEQRFISLSHAAPEQLRGGAVTAACDVYGLGALLYELLAGRPPFLLGERTPAQLEQEICEVDPPPPGRAGGIRVDRDLDLITLRCLRKQPADRYASVDQLADDVRRWLDGRPVAARRGNGLYRAGRFLRRHRVAMALAAVILAILVTAGVLLWRQQLATATQHARAEEMTSLIVDALRTANPGSGGARQMSAREVFERVAVQAQASPSLSAVSRSRVLFTVAEVLLELREYARAEKMLAGLLAGELEPALRSEAAFAQAQVLIATEDAARASPLVAAQLKQEADPARQARWALLEGVVDNREGRSQEGLRKLEAVNIALLPPELRDYHGREHSKALWALGRKDEAVAEIAAVAAAQTARLGADAPATFETLRYQAVLESQRGNFERTEAISARLLESAEKNFGRNSANYLAALDLHSITLEHRGDMKASVEVHKQILAIAREQYGENSIMVAKMNLNMGSLLNEIGEYAEAETYYRKSVELATRSMAPDDIDLLFTQFNLAFFLALRDKPAEAQPVLALVHATLRQSPHLAELDVGVPPPVIQRLIDYQLKPDAVRRAALARSLRDNLGKSKEFMLDQMVKDIAAKAKTLGVEPAAP
jgi:eukaryotic-like serine/threonine-protein kinase